MNAIAIKPPSRNIEKARQKNHETYGNTGSFRECRDWRDDVVKGELGSSRSGVVSPIDIG